jgi:CspA family cold shock protein
VKQSDIGMVADGTNCPSNETVVKRQSPRRSWGILHRLSSPPHGPTNRSNVVGGDPDGGFEFVQGVVKAYDPVTRDGIVVTDDGEMAEYELAGGALEGSIFRMLRPGQRVIFDLDDDRRAISLRIGSEVDMGTPELTVSE